MTYIDSINSMTADSMTIDSMTDLIAQIQINETTFELLLKNDFIILSHPMMDERLFPHTMNIVDIIHDHFGDVHINAQGSFQGPIFISLS